MPQLVNNVVKNFLIKIRSPRLNHANGPSVTFILKNNTKVNFLTNCKNYFNEITYSLFRA